MNNNDLEKKKQQLNILDHIQSDLKLNKGKESGILGVKQSFEELLATLNNLPNKVKIRIIFKDYQNWVNFLPHYQRYKDKFTIFKDKKDFIMADNLVISKQENITLKESLIKWLEENKVNETIKSILLEKIK